MDDDDWDTDPDFVNKESIRQGAKAADLAPVSNTVELAQMMKETALESTQHVLKSEEFRRGGRVSDMSTDRAKEQVFVAPEVRKPQYARETRVWGSKSPVVAPPSGPAPSGGGYGSPTPSSVPPRPSPASRFNAPQSSAPPTVSVPKPKAKPKAKAKAKPKSKPKPKPSPPVHVPSPEPEPQPVPEPVAAPPRPAPKKAPPPPPPSSSKPIRSTPAAAPAAEEASYGDDLGGYGDSGGYDEGGDGLGYYDEGGDDLGCYDEGGDDLGYYDEGGDDLGYYDEGGEDLGYYDEGGEAGGDVAHALYDYEGEAEGDLSFSAGDQIVIIDKSDPSGWWLGELNGVQGYFPSNFVEV